MSGNRPKPAGRIFLGAIAGVIATYPMTIAMQKMFKRLPRSERYPLPPREITQSLLGSEKRQPADETVDPVTTLVSHFAYGALCGSLFTLSRFHESRPISRGMIYGVGVWAGSYLGLMPGLGILVPATSHPNRRNGLMIAAHLVWGAGLGLSAGTLESSLESFESRKNDRMPDQKSFKKSR